MNLIKRFVIMALVRFWQWRDGKNVTPVPQYVASMNPSDNIQQSMNLVIPLKDPTPYGRALLLQMMATEADGVAAGLHNTAVVHFARFTIVGDNVVMFSIFDGDFHNYIRDFIYNIGSFFNHLMEHTTNPSKTPVERYPDDFVEWVKSVDAFQVGEDITAFSRNGHRADLDNLPRRLALTMAKYTNIQLLVYRNYPGYSVAQLRERLKVGW